MAGIREQLFNVHALTRKFEQLISSAHLHARRSNEPTSADTARTPMQELTWRGANPGALRSFVYVPKRLASRPALVVALHGCGQTAAGYDHGSGWSMVAEKSGFVVLLPEQQAANNPKSCFSWFLPGDTSRHAGEAASIHEMIEHVVTEYGIDPHKIFITGLSAGGAMTSVMLATYPETFAAGAIIAGLPYGAASSVQEAFQAMFTDQQMFSRALGDRVRSASPHRGPWPRISVWHGTADATVMPSNADHIVAQWADVHGLEAIPSRIDRIGEHVRRLWNDESGSTVIEAVSLAGMAHGVPLAASGGAACGHAGPFFLDVGCSSTLHIAQSWGLIDAIPADDAIAEGGPDAAKPRYAEAATAAPNWVFGADARPSTGSATRPADANPADVTAIISAAMKAAGLDPDSAGSAPRGAFGQISTTIEAALKAAGLKR